VSHAAGDYLTGLKPTWSGGPMIGLELYRRPLIDFVIESTVVVCGWLVYRQSLPLQQRSSRPVFTLLGALVLIQGAADVVFSLTTGLRKC
jgi:hypothetical protein